MQADSNLLLAVFKSDGTLVGAPVLDANLPSTTNASFNVTWTGQSYMAGWWGAGSVGYFAMVDAQANVLGVQSVPGAVASASPVAVAGNGTSLGVAYALQTSSKARLQIYSQGGAFLGTTDLDMTALFALAGSPSAFVVMGTDLSNDVVAMSIPVQGGMPGSGSAHVFPTGADPSALTAAFGASDGVGAAFLMQYSPNGVWFGYLDSSLENPFELSEVAAGARVADIAGGTGGRLGLFYTIGGQLFGRQAGYASLSGAVCAAGIDCASDVCTPKVVGGPAAYSVCE